MQFYEGFERQNELKIHFVCISVAVQLKAERLHSFRQMQRI